MTAKAKAFIAAVITAGAATVAFALIHWRSDDLTRFFVYLLLFAAAATLKCRVPGVSILRCFSSRYLAPRPCPSQK